MSRCQWPEGMEIRPDGVHRLDPCTYDVIEEHRDVTVRVLRCSRCGHQEIEWEDTGRWIPVSERLPKDREGVILTIAHHSYRYVDAANHVTDGSFASAVKPGTKYTPDGEDRPVAWMPIPEPYREEDINPT